MRSLCHGRGQGPSAARVHTSHHSVWPFLLPLAWLSNLTLPHGLKFPTLLICARRSAHATTTTTNQCKHHTHLARLRTRIFSCACGSRRIAAVCARHLTNNHHAAHMPCSVHSLTHLTRHRHRALLLPLPCCSFQIDHLATPLFGRSAEQSPLGGFELTLRLK